MTKKKTSRRSIISSRNAMICELVRTKRVREVAALVGLSEARVYDIVASAGIRLRDVRSSAERSEPATAVAVANPALVETTSPTTNAQRSSRAPSDAYLCIVVDLATGTDPQKVAQDNDMDVLMVEAVRRDLEMRGIL